jgi:hypothetical protein
MLSKSKSSALVAAQEMNLYEWVHLFFIFTLKIF